MTDAAHRATCHICGSLGNYTDPGDAANAELQHQINAHPAQLYADPPEVPKTRENTWTGKGRPKKPKPDPKDLKWLKKRR